VSAGIIIARVADRCVVSLLVVHCGQISPVLIQIQVLAEVTTQHIIKGVFGKDLD
jgi:hypothetical protein